MTKLWPKVLQRHMLPSLVPVVTAFILSGCGDSFGYGMAWEDLNCNGAQDSEEAPLAGVCVWISSDVTEPPPSREECANEYLQTDSEGISGWAFFAGASCGDIFVFAQAPDGYDPTTDTVVNDCYAEFGFAPEGACPQRSVLTPDDLAAQRLAESRRTTNLIGVAVFGVPVLIGLTVAGVKLHARRRSKAATP